MNSKDNNINGPSYTEPGKSGTPPNQGGFKKPGRGGGARRDAGAGGPGKIDEGVGIYEQVGMGKLVGLSVRRLVS